MGSGDVAGVVAGVVADRNKRPIAQKSAENSVKPKFALICIRKINACSRAETKAKRRGEK